MSIKTPAAYPPIPPNEVEAIVKIVCRTILDKLEEEGVEQDDALQAVHVALLRKGRYDPTKAKVSTYITLIAYGILCDLLKAKRKKAWSQLGQIEDVSIANKDRRSDCYQEVEYLEYIDTLSKEMPDPLTAIVVRKLALGETRNEIAASLDISCKLAGEVIQSVRLILANRDSPTPLAESQG